jgi:hypothetical protein
MKLRLALLVAVLGGLSCSATENGSVALIWNQGDPDPFTEADAAAPATIVLSAISVQSADGGSSDDAAIALAQSAYQAGGTLTIPAQDGFDVDILQAALFDSAQNEIIFGRTIPVQLGGIQNTTLDIFVQRTGQFARLPQALATTPLSPLAVTLENEYILIADGSGLSNATGDSVYDMNAWAFIQSPIPLPCAPLSIAPLGGSLVLVICAPMTGTVASCSGDGVTACAFDASGIVTTTAATLGGASSVCGWADLAGGATVLGTNGDAFIVGGTRSSSPSDCVLEVGQAGTLADGGFVPGLLTVGTFNAKRQGAAAAWSATRGLVIAGGNQSAKDPPVEYLGVGAGADGGTFVSTALSGYVTGDLAQGSGGAIHDADDTLVLAGGTLPDKTVAGVRVFDLKGCSQDCDPEPESDAGTREGGMDAGADADEDAGVDAGADADEEAGAMASVDLGGAQGFAMTASTALFVGPAGARPGGETRAFLVSTSGTSVTGVKAVPLQVNSRKGTTAIRSPVASVVVIGGATTMESFVPQPDKTP